MHSLGKPQLFEDLFGSTAYHLRLALLVCGDSPVGIALRKVAFVRFVVLNCPCRLY